MIARSYTTKIEIFQFSAVDDSYGGSTINELSLGKFWCDVLQQTSNRDNSYGKSDLRSSFIFKIRSNPIITPRTDNICIEYDNIRYMVSQIKYEDNLFRFTNIIANA